MLWEVKQQSLAALPKVGHAFILLKFARLPNSFLKTCNKAVTGDENPCGIFGRPMLQFNGGFAP